MKVLGRAWVLVVVSIFSSSGCKINALSYDYHATTKCLSEPRRAQYGGGIIANPEFNHGVEGWTVFGRGSIKEGISKNGNRYVVSYNRSHSVYGLSQKVQLQEGKLFTFSAWIQVSRGSESVAVVFRTAKNVSVHVGRVIAKTGCWSFLKGGTFANFSGPIDILFESNNTRVDTWVDSVSLKPFTMEEWRSQQEKSIKKERKSNVAFLITYANGTAVEGARVSIKQTKPSFPFGCGMNFHILSSTGYRKWFASRFKFTTFTNAMKWYSTEEVRGHENYTIADAMVKFCKLHGISIRGHNIFWDDPKYQPKWVESLSPDELRKAAAKRINSVVKRYKGDLIAWDVMNENVHFSFYEDQLGKNASAKYYLRAFQLDPGTRMFMNEYNTIEDSEDENADPSKYNQKLEEILSFPGNQRMLSGIGLQGHFSSDQLNLAYMRSSMDILGSKGIPIWLTEVSVGPGPKQAEYLEQVLRESYSHPAVQGIIMFAGPDVAGFKNTSLADINFQNTLAGDVVDNLIDQWKFKRTKIKANSKGCFEISLFHGDYNITVKDPTTNSLTIVSFEVTKDVKSAHIFVGG